MFLSTPLSQGTCFPSPTEDLKQKPLDLNTLVIKNPIATYIVRASGNTMEKSGIFSGDYLVVDRSIQPISGQVVLAVVNDTFTVKRYHLEQGKPYLMSDPMTTKPVLVAATDQHTLWGVVTYVLHKPCLY